MFIYLIANELKFSVRFFIDKSALYLGNNLKFPIMQIYNLVKESTFSNGNGFRSMAFSNKFGLKISTLTTIKHLTLGVLFLLVLAFGNKANAATITSVNGNPWSNASTWDLNRIPASNDDVVLNHYVTLVTDITCNSMTINTGGRLTVNAGYYCTITGNLNFPASGGSIEILSDVNGTGSVTFGSLSNPSFSGIYFNRYMTGSAVTKLWHGISAPMTNLSFANFFNYLGLENLNIVRFSSNGLFCSFGRYLEPTNNWEYPWDNTASNCSGNFIPGKSYSMAINANLSIKMSGRLTTSPVTVPISFSTGTAPYGGFGWNTLGNPFTSAILISSYIAANSSQLDPLYGGLYVWNPAGYYEVTTLAGPLSHLQVGQGFVTRSKAGGGTISFTYDMRRHAPTAPFKAGSLSWPSIELKVASTDMTRTTLVNFNSSMTVGVDPFYDAGILKSGGGLELYTRLIQDSGVDFAIQCLPDAGYDKMVIPVSLDFVPGGEVTFSAKTLNLPAECQPVLEDRLLGISTSLNTTDASYKVILPGNTTGIKRFYLHLDGIASIIPNKGVSDLKAYTVGREIHIQGSVAAQSVADLYDLSGRRVGTYKLQSSDNNILQPYGIFGGFYLLRIMEGNKPKFVGKIRIQ